MGTNVHSVLVRKLRVLALIVVLTGSCSALAISASHATAAAPVATAATATVPLSSIPASARSNYGDWHAFARLFANPYPNYKAPKPPWKFCESTNYLANGWELGNQAELKALVSQYQKAGLATGGLTTVNSNLSVPQQISQLNSLMSQGCNVIFAIPGSPTAFCPTFDKARAKNILVVTDDTPIYCDNVMNSSFPEYTSAQIQSAALGNKLGGKGHVVMLTGIPGAVGESVTVAGFMAGLKKYPNISVDQVAGDWTESVAQTAMVKYLATHPETVDGILDGAGMATGGELALQQAGRPLAKEGFYDPECSTFALWKQHPGMVVTSQNQGPEMAAYESFIVAERMLYGQKPIVNTLLYPIPGPTQASFNQWYKSTMTLKSTCYASPPASAITGNSYYNNLFKGGQAPKVLAKLVPIG
jgi:ABC-type sugar transport system substrate-binding protein